MAKIMVCWDANLFHAIFGREKGRFEICDVMHSFDDDDLIPLDGKAGTPPLKICHPGDGDGFALQGGLFKS
jgi:hypothetical protein